MANYRIISLDLTTARTRAPIDGGQGFRDAYVDNISILSFPVGAILSLHLGESGDAIALSQTLQNIEDICEDGGIFVTHPAQPGTIVQIMLSFGGGGARVTGA